MKRVTYEIEILTPAFIGGSNPANAELTANGIRGHLRWWLRCIGGGRLGGNLACVAAIETRLFGMTKQRSAIRIAVTRQPQASSESLRTRGLYAEDILQVAGAPASVRNRVEIRGEGGERASQPFAYLGFGPVSFNGATSRKYLPPGRAAFFLQQGRLDPMDEDLLHDALWAWMNLGAIGSRARRGFGSFACVQVKNSSASSAVEPVADMTIPADPSAFDAACSALFQRNVTAGASLPEWSHLSSDAAVYRASTGFDDWQTAMTSAAAWLIAFRRRYGMTTGRDYDWFKAPRASGVPDRAGFGLPLPFSDPPAHRKEIANWKGHRRASPLLVRIAKLDRQYYPVFTYIPARFLPAGEQIRFHGFSAPPGPAHAAIVPQFLTELTARGKTVKVV